MDNIDNIWKARLELWASQITKRKPNKKVNISILTPNVDKDKYKNKPRFVDFIINTALNINNNIEIKGDKG